MALKRISDLVAASLPLAGTEVVELDDGAGGAFKATVQDIADLGGGAVADFTDLGDVPAAYTGHTLKLVRVNAGETGLEFVAAGGGTGDVVGPASAVDDRIATFDGVTGKMIQDGGATVAQLDTRGKHAIYVAAGAMRPSVTGGCATLAGIASAANMPDIVSLDFDTTTVEYAQFGIVMPEKWDGGTVTVRYHWSHAATVTNFGAAFGIQAVSVGDSDPIAVAYGTRVDVTDTGGTTDDLYTTDETAAITVAGTPAGGEMVFFRLSRRPGDVGDTLAVDARLHGITVYCTTDASTDA